jgi:ABC transporter substrate binding protein
VISFSYGGLILLRSIITSRANFCGPVFRFTSCVLSAALVFFFFCMSSVQAEPLRVTVLLSEEGGVYQAFSDLLRVKLPVSGFALNTVSVDKKLIVSDIYIAVGMKAASVLSNTHAPVLSVLVPKAGYDKLPHGQPHHSAIFLDQPMDRQVALLLDALPSTKRVGVLYSEPPEELSELKQLLADRNVRLHARAVDSKEPLGDALQNVLRDSEVLFVLPDPVVYNSGTIRNILLATYRREIPLIGISQAYVRAGALFAIYSTPDQIAVQTAEALRHFSASGKLPPNQYPKEFDVSVNSQVARSLDIPVKAAEKLRSDVRKVQ